MVLSFTIICIPFSNATFLGYCNALDSYSYQNPEGQMRLRVATIMRKWVDGSNTEVSSKRFPCSREILDSCSLFTFPFCMIF